MIMTGYVIIGFATSRELSSLGKCVNFGHLQDTPADKDSQLKPYEIEVFLSNDTNQSKLKVLLWNHLFHPIAIVTSSFLVTGDSCIIKYKVIIFSFFYQFRIGKK